MCIVVLCIACQTLTISRLIYVLLFISFMLCIFSELLVCGFLPEPTTLEVFLMVQANDEDDDVHLAMVSILFCCLRQWSVIKSLPHVVRKGL